MAPEPWLRNRSLDAFVRPFLYHWSHPSLHRHGSPLDKGCRVRDDGLEESPEADDATFGIRLRYPFLLLPRFEDIASIVGKLTRYDMIRTNKLEPEPVSDTDFEGWMSWKLSVAATAYASPAWTSRGVIRAALSRQVAGHTFCCRNSLNDLSTSDCLILLTLRRAVEVENPLPLSLRAR